MRFQIIESKLFHSEKITSNSFIRTCDSKKLTKIAKLLFRYSWFFSHSDYFHSKFLIFAFLLLTAITAIGFVIILCIYALEIILDNVPCSNRPFVRAAICKEGFAVNQLSDFFRSSECLSFTSRNRESSIYKRGSIQPIYKRQRMILTFSSKGFSNPEL